MTPATPQPPQLSSAQARAALGFSPQDHLTPARIHFVLQSRLDQLSRLPASPQLELARTSLRRAAAVLLQQFDLPTARPAASSPPSLPQHQLPTSRTLAPRLADLTDFDRQVLAVLVANGGWNVRSRAHLVAIAAASGVTVHGLLRVIHSLAAHARSHGPRLAVTGTVARPAPVVSLHASSSAAPSPLADQIDSQLADAARAARSARTIRLSILFGLITTFLFLILLRMLLTSSPHSAPIARDPAQAVPSSPFASSSSDRSPQSQPAHSRLAFFASPPTFLGNGLPEQAASAADAARTLTADIQKLLTKFEITDSPADVNFRFWNEDLNIIQTGYFLLDDSTRTSVHSAFVEVFHFSPEKTADRLAQPLTPSTLRFPGSDPLDLWRNTWRVGFTAILAFHPDLPAHVTIPARRSLQTTLQLADLPASFSFHQAARAYLDLQLATLLDHLTSDQSSADAWELWLSAQHDLTPKSDSHLALAHAARRILQSTVRIDNPSPSLDVLGRLVKLLPLDDPSIKSALLETFESDKISPHNLWLLTSLLALDDRASWFPDDLVTPPDADAITRSRHKDRLASLWPVSEPSHDSLLAQGSGITVDPALGERWASASAASIAAPLPDDAAALLRRLLITIRINQAAACLVAQAPVRAADALDHADKLLAALDSENPDSALVSFARLRKPRLGQPIGTDGAWSAQYNATLKSKDEHLQSLRNLRSTAGTDLNPIDAQLFVHELFRAPTTELRSIALSILTEQFSAAPIIADQLVLQFIDTPRSAELADSITRLTGVILPSIHSDDWETQARLALIRHHLTLTGDLPDSTHLIVQDILDALGDHDAALQRQPFLSIPPPSPLAAADSIVRSLRASASSLLSSNPAPGPLPDLAHRLATRNALALGPLQKFLVRQIGQIDLLAYITSASQPALRETVLRILADSSSLRARANHVLQQSLIAERTLSQLWRLRMALPASTASGFQLPQRIIPARPPLSRPARRLTASSALAIAMLAHQPLAFPQDVTSQRPRTSDFALRLSALHPSRPIDYFELAEDIADQAADEADRALARRLFSLAAVLDSPRLAFSSCLALAQLAPTDAEKRRLLALASILNSSLLFLPDLAGPSNAPSHAAELAVSKALALYRAGEGPRAIAVVASAGADDLLDSLSHALPGGVKRFRQDAQLYRGQRAPALTPPEVSMLLRLEIALLSGSADTQSPTSLWPASPASANSGVRPRSLNPSPAPALAAGADDDGSNTNTDPDQMAPENDALDPESGRSWSSDLLLSRGLPLVEVDPNHLADTLGIDASRPIYRNGQWLPVSP